MAEFFKGYTEKLPYERYVVKETRPSRFDPSYQITEVVAMRCPRCTLLLSSLDHSVRQTCNCGLKMQLWGGSLTVGE